MKLLKKVVFISVIFAVLVMGVYILGPQVESPVMERILPEVESDLSLLENKILKREAGISNLKPGNASRIVWKDSSKAKTPYAIIYLHGWSASSEEGAPVHESIARRYGCNLYLPRLAGHGIEETENMLYLTASEYMNSVKEALAVAKKLGNKVIVLATSTGASMALYLAGDDPDVAGLLLYSPNIKVYDPNAKWLSRPWGLQLARWVTGSRYHTYEANELKRKYWTTKYRLEALTHLQVLTQKTMTHDTFQSVTRPVFMGYFYKDEATHDQVVSVPAMLEMYSQLGTPSHLKRKKAFPEAGNHVLASHVVSKDLKSVQKETCIFIEEILGLKPL
ncbi:alpha/beta hydrolase [Ascidiimonas aurantiaca]|uniref:alpha/beta hydrolase n=1 Tax=Ascidiimonas aurantiaca TaxID=1685432 RepID=UPI0030EC0B40